MNSFNGTFVEKRYDELGNVYVTFKTGSYQDREIVKELQKDALYRLKCAEVKSRRSLEQNNYLWALIHDISEARNSERATSGDDWEIYIEALERAQAKFEIVACLPQALPLLKQQFRAVKELNEFEHKGRTFKQVKVFYGSSKMDAAEMAQLLNTVIDMAVEEGVELRTYDYE